MLMATRHKTFPDFAKRQKTVPCADGLRNDPNSDDEPIFPKAVAAVAPAKSVAQAKAVEEGDLKVTHQINGTWKFCLLNGRYLAMKLSKGEWEDNFGAWTSDEEYSENEEAEPEAPEGYRWYLAEAGGMVDEETPHLLLGPMLRSGAASRAAIQRPLGDRKLEFSSFTNKA